jgi:hypothetical protein
MKSSEKAFLHCEVGPQARKPGIPLKSFEFFGKTRRAQNLKEIRTIAGWREPGFGCGMDAEVR